MRILAVDASTYVGTVAFVVDGELQAEWSASVRAAHGETLLPHMQRVLELSGASLADVDLFAVGIGPGSFTGVRIGVATLKGLAMVEAKPIVGVTSLRVLARGFSGRPGLKVPVVDAHKGEVYCAAYDLDSAGELVEVVAPFHDKPAAAAAHLRTSCLGQALSLAGNGLTRYGEAFSGPLGEPSHAAPSFCGVPRAACLADEADRQLARLGPSDLGSLEPMYLRPSDAKLPTTPLR